MTMGAILQKDINQSPGVEFGKSVGASARV
jgi:hypothetical protein